MSNGWKSEEDTIKEIAEKLTMGEEVLHELKQEIKQSGKNNGKRDDMPTEIEFKPVSPEAFAGGDFGSTDDLDALKYSLGAYIPEEDELKYQVANLGQPSKQTIGWDPMEYRVVKFDKRHGELILEKRKKGVE